MVIAQGSDQVHRDLYAQLLYLCQEDVRQGVQ